MTFLDLHYHAEPDLYLRRESVLAAGALARRLGGSLVLKSHLGSTVDGVLVAREAGFDNLFASLTLNAAAGGVDYRVVQREVGKYARRVDAPLLVYLPTITPHPRARRLAQTYSHPCLADAGQRPEAITEDGRLRPAVLDVMRLALDQPIRLATGHAVKAEVLLILEEAARLGLSNILVTHATHPCVGFTVDEILGLTATTNATRIWVEQTALTMLLGALSEQAAGRLVRDVPRLIFSSDLGQTTTMDLAAWQTDTARLTAAWQVSAARWRTVSYENPAMFLGLPIDTQRYV